MFSQVVQTKKIRKDALGNYIVAEKLLNGNIRIDGVLYCQHSMTSAIQTFRKNNPARR